MRQERHLVGAGYRFVEINLLETTISGVWALGPSSGTANFRWES